MSTDDRKEKLERFFKEVADLTANHEVIAGEAVVLPSSLGDALSRVDSDWYCNTVDPAIKEGLTFKRLAVLAELTAYDQELGMDAVATLADAASQMTPNNRYPEVSAGPDIGKEAIESDSERDTGDPPK